MAHKILCVDDSPTIILSLRQPLEEAGFEVISASNGQEGIELLNKHWDVSLIYLDVNMPVMDGFEFLKKIRANKTTSGIRVVMVTTEGSKDSILKAKDLGISGWLIKPAVGDSILQVAEKFLGKQSA
ncbi:MAG: response regulator [Pseudobacteriovorax sp.]|nr:response regulator [Pseudobacteriovorax sp.]